MSKIGNHRVEVQESEEYLAGWASAKRGDRLPHTETMGLPLLRVRLRNQRLGWQDYHDQEQSK
jgi:hypothetical protein